MSTQIWGTKGSTCTDRALFTAGELSIPFTYNHIDFAGGAHKKPEHLKRQPFGKVPAAEVQGIPLYESRAISRALARSSPSGEKLFPSSDLARVAAFEQWASLESGTITPIFEKVVGERIFKPQFHKQPTDEAATKKAIEDGQTALKVLNDQLTQHQYVAGDEFTLVDIFMSTYFNYFTNTEEGKQVLQQYSAIAQWWERISSRPAWQKVKSEQWKGE